MTTINTPIQDNIALKIFNSFVEFHDDKILIYDHTPKEIAIFFYIIMPKNFRIVYIPTNRHCSCGNLMHNHQYTPWKMDKTYPLFKLRLRCPKCGTTIGPDLEGIAKKGCNYTNDIRNVALDISTVEHISYEKISDYIEQVTHIKIPRQNVYNYKIDECESYILEKEAKIQEEMENRGIESSGFIGHDESFLRINGIKYAYLTMLDSTNQSIINDTILPEKDFSDFLEDFITFSLKDLSVYSNPNTPNPPHPSLLPDLKKDTLTGDGYPAYPGIAKRNNMKFHPCGFHIIKNQREKTWKHQRNINRKINSNKNKITKNTEKIEKYKSVNKGYFGRIPLKAKKRRSARDKATDLIRKNRKISGDNKKLKEEHDELTSLSNRLSNILDADTIYDAKRRFNILNNQKENLPDEFVKALDTMGKDLDATLAHIENENVPKTNNWLELFYRVVFPKRFRNRFKTFLGVDNFLRLAKIRWNERVVLGEKVEIERENIWDKLWEKYATT